MINNKKGDNYIKIENRTNIFCDCQVKILENIVFIQLFFITSLLGVVFVKWYIKLCTGNNFDVQISLQKSIVSAQYAEFKFIWFRKKYHKYIWVHDHNSSHQNLCMCSILWLVFHFSHRPKSLQLCKNSPEKGKSIRKIYFSSCYVQK